MALDIEALSAVQVAQRRWHRDGDAFLTLIVKATFAYGATGEAWLVEPEPLSLEIAEEAVPEPLLRRGARTARATELAPNLRRAGLSVLGFACAPSGTMARHIELRLAVSRGDDTLVDKRLVVVGDRQSEDAFPDPFDALPIVDELCFGGPGDPENPRGVGAGPDPSTLPNVLPFDRSARFASFGPLPAKKTSALFTSLDEPVTEIRADADWEAFQTAPADQRLVGAREFFAGDERLVMQGMDREAPVVDVKLPRVRALARWTRTGRGARALELRADCLVVDTEARRVSLTWRGQIPAPADPDENVRAAVALAFGDATEAEAAAWPDDLATIGIGTQNTPALAALAAAARARPVRSAPHALDVTAAPARPETLTANLVFDGSSAEPAWVARPQKKDDPPRDAAPIPGAPWSPIATTIVEGAVYGEETFEPSLGPSDNTATRIDIVVPPAPPSAPAAPAAPPAWTPRAPEAMTIGALHVAAQAAQAAQAAKTARTEAHLDGGAPDRPPTSSDDAPEHAPRRPTTLRRAAEGASNGASASVRPRRESPERSECLARIEKGQSLEGMSFAGVDLSGVDFRERSLARADLGGARLEGALLARCNLTGAKLEDADLTAADLTGAILTRADASRAKLDRAKLERAQLVDTIFEGARANGASFKNATGMRPCFADADLSGAQFGGASLDRADLSGASLDGADFSGATMLRSRFDGARGDGVLLNGARMNDTRWEGAKFDGLEARGLAAQHSLWLGARLTTATLEKADLRGALLREATLARASFSDADLRDADLLRADVTGANFSRANLEGATLARIGGDGAVFDGARLSGADVRHVTLGALSMRDASAVRTRFDGASVASANFSRADLRHASFRDAKLGRADLSSALVDGTDLRGADLEGATLYKVDLARARRSSTKTK